MQSECPALIWPYSNGLKRRHYLHKETQTTIASLEEFLKRVEKQPGLEAGCSPGLPSDGSHAVLEALSVRLRGLSDTRVWALTSTAMGPLYPEHFYKSERRCEILGEGPRYVQCSRKEADIESTPKPLHLEGFTMQCGIQRKEVQNISLGYGMRIINCRDV